MPPPPITARTIAAWLSDLLDELPPEATLAALNLLEEETARRQQETVRAIGRRGPAPKDPP